MYGATMDSCIVVDSVGGVVGDVTAEWSLIEDGWPGVGNFDLDPLLADPYGGDFSLLPHSPCIDRGNPSLPADPDGSRRDMGAEPWVWEQRVQSQLDRFHGRLPSDGIHERRHELRPAGRGFPAS